ncbi:MAG: tetratricopeptide repeat protein [Deltaproteobacteria bacterium]|nr:tetratricopeptide repeat protein [Deltaproteobacteria bacterium]
MDSKDEKEELPFDGPPPFEIERDAAHIARWEAAEEGAELLREGEIDLAIAELKKVIEKDSQNEYAYFFLGAAYFEKGDFERALKAYYEALRIAPRYLGALVGAGHCLRLLGKHDQAIRVGKEVLLQRKEDPDALYLLALTYLAKGERSQSKEYLKRFLATNPELEVAKEAEGLIAILEGRIDGVLPDPPKPFGSS